MTNNYQVQVLNGLQFKQFINHSLSAQEFNKNQYYKGMQFLNRTQFNIKELEPLKDDKYVLLIDANETEHNIIGVINLQNITKPYFKESYDVFLQNKIPVKWLLDYIEIRKDYQKHGLVKILLKGLQTTILPNEGIYISGFTSDGIQAHLSQTIKQVLPNYHFYLLTEDNKALAECFKQSIVTLKDYNHQFIQNFH